MLTQLHNSHFYPQPYHPEYYSSPMDLTDDDWPFHVQRTVDEESYLHNLEAMRREQLYQDEMRNRREQNQLFMEEMRRREIEKEKLRRHQELIKMRLLEQMYLQEKIQREIDRKHYEEALARERLTRHRQSQPTLLHRQKAYPTSSDIFTTILDQVPHTDTTRNHYVLQPETHHDDLLQHPYTNSMLKVKSKVVRVSPGAGMNKINRLTKPVVLATEISHDKTKDPKSSMKCQETIPTRLEIRTVIDQDSSAVANDHTINLQPTLKYKVSVEHKSEPSSNSTSKIELSKRKIHPKVGGKKRIIKYAGLIGDVEDASDSECEDEFSSYMRNRRPGKGKWMEPIEGVKTIVL